MKNAFRLVVLVFAAVSAMVLGQQKVDQGKPGTQGGWIVTCTNCGITVDGGLTVNGSGTLDGGFVQVVPYQCAITSPNATTTVGVTATNVPAAAASGRWYATVCVSLENTGAPVVKCRADGTDPVMGAGNAGDTLGLGDCVTYPMKSARAIRCISGGSVFTTSYECVP